MSNVSHWKTNGSRMTLSVPFAKVDEENRLVSGFATLDNVDKVNDIVTLEASQLAFDAFRGNIREMHMPIAVGRMVDFEQREFYDSKTEKFYQGIYVTVYVSKGAQDTWEKVLDGTLQGFSIGAYIDEDSNEYVAEYESVIRFIKAYTLVELSLVDNPANDLANVFTIQKSDAGFNISGMLAEVKAENVLWCDHDAQATITVDEKADCSVCGQEMNNIGWFEQGENKSEKVRSIIKTYVDAHKVTEGGVNQNMLTNEETVTEKAEVIEEVVEPTVEKVEEVEVSEEAETVEKAEESIEEVVDFDVEKAFGDLLERVNGLEKSIESTIEVANKAATALSDLSEKFEQSINEVADKAKDAAFKALESTGLSDRLDKVESATAEKKSGELGGESAKTTEKGSFWGGAFLNVENL